MGPIPLDWFVGGGAAMCALLEGGPGKPYSVVLLHVLRIVLFMSPPHARDSTHLPYGVRPGEAIDPPPPMTQPKHVRAHRGSE